MAILLDTNVYLHAMRSDADALTVPLHRELRPGLLRGLIRRSGMSIDEFAALL